MAWGWRGRGRGGGWVRPWPRRGPFSYLPPWQRSGWLCGRGACWWLFAPYSQTTIPKAPAVIPPASTAIPKEQEIALLENQAKWLEQTLEQIRNACMQGRVWKEVCRGRSGKPFLETRI